MRCSTLRQMLRVAVAFQTTDPETGSAAPLIAPTSPIPKTRSTEPKSILPQSSTQTGDGGKISEGPSIGPPITATRGTRPVAKVGRLPRQQSSFVATSSSLLPVQARPLRTSTTPPSPFTSEPGPNVQRSQRSRTDVVDTNTP